MPLTNEERADLEAMSSGQISDAMEALNLRRSVVTGFLMLAAPGSKIVGTAVTLRQVPKNANEDREARLTRHREVTRKIAGKFLLRNVLEERTTWTIPRTIVDKSGPAHPPETDTTFFGHHAHAPAAPDGPEQVALVGGIGADQVEQIG